METLEPILAKTPLFRDLPPTYVALLTGCASNVRFAAGDLVFRQGDPADLFYIIRHGQVALEVHAPGQGSITIDTLEEGELVGWSWLFPPYRSYFDARAVTMTRALALDGACLRGKCDSDHSLGYMLMKRIAPMIVDRLQATRMRLLDLYGSHD